MTFPDPPLLLITDRRQARLPIEAIAAACFAAGCRWLSLREKDLDGAARIALLQRLVALGKPHGAQVMVHEDLAAAAAAGAAGVHLPGGVSPAAARRSLGPGALIGCSCHDAEEVASAAAAGADYASLSPIFPSASKPGYGPALGLGGLVAAAAATRLPLIALGGVEAGNVADCIAAGAAGIAVMGGVMRSDDPGTVMAGLLKRLGAGLAARRGTGS